MHQKPPKLAEWLLTKMLHDDIWKSPLGDFEEYYAYLAHKEGVGYANRWYWSQVLRFVPSKMLYNLNWMMTMFKNYLKISYRSLKNNFSYSFINIFGLAVGLASFILIMLFIQYEYSYDTHHAKQDRIYRVVRHNPLDDYHGSSWAALTPIPLASSLKEELPEIEASTNISLSSAFFLKDGASFLQEGISMGGGFFDVFTHKWIYGNPQGAMDDPGSVIITQSVSEKYFGRANPVGEAMDMIIDRKRTSKIITGVIEDTAPNSHFSFDYIIDDRSTSYYSFYADEWPQTNHYTYIALKEGVQAGTVQEKLPLFANKHLAKSWYYERNLDKLPAFHLQPLTDIHLKSSHLSFNIANHSDVKYVYMFAVVALIILVIACVNYMNLATARSLTRAKEVGMRKVIGAQRFNLIVQFLSEAVIISLLSIMTAFILVYLLLPAFNTLVDRPFDAGVLLNMEFLLIAFAISLCVGIISGSYPALYMSALQPMRVLKNEIQAGKGNRFMRNILVVGQFTVTIILVIGSLVVFRQLNYIQTTDTGLDREQIVAARISDGAMWNKYETVVSELQKNSNITHVSSSNNLPTKISNRTDGAEWEGKEGDDALSIYNAGVSRNFTELLDLELVAGRAFSSEQHNEEVTEYLLNESAVHALGWTNEEVLGKKFKLNAQEGPIVGVLKDFNFLSLRMDVEPLTLFSNQGSRRQSYLLMKVQGDEIPGTLAHIEAVLKEFSPDYPFDYVFLDDSFDNMYRNELRLGSMFNYLTMLALCIACMGLLGLASFIIEQRTKEVGIRKVLGANVMSIVALVNKDFIRLVALSFVLAVPVGWFLMDTWLQDFAYRIELGPGTFLAAGLLAIGVALLTVSYKSIRTAFMNPVDSLRSE